MFVDQPCQAFSDLEKFGELHKIRLELKDRHPSQPGTASLGLLLSGHKDPAHMGVFVVSITPDSPAAVDGRIWKGDQLLQVHN